MRKKRHRRLTGKLRLVGKNSAFVYMSQSPRRATVDKLALPGAEAMGDGGRLT